MLSSHTHHSHSTKIVIDPLHLNTRQTHDILRDLLRQFNDKDSFKSHVTYIVDSKIGGSSTQIQVKLTDDLIREKKRNRFFVGNKDSVLAEYDSLVAEGVSVFPLKGRLVLDSHKIKTETLEQSQLITGKVNVTNMSQELGTFMCMILEDANELLQISDFKKGWNGFLFKENEADVACYVQLDLSHRLDRVVPSSHHHAAPFLYTVFGESLGEGGYGEVYEVIGELKPEKNRSLVYEARSLIAKQQEHDDGYLSDEAKREHMLADATPHLKPKYIITKRVKSGKEDKRISVRYEERMRGVDLLDVLNRDLDTKNASLSNDLKLLEREKKIMQHHGEQLSDDTKENLDNTCRQKQDVNREAIHTQNAKQLAMREYELSVIAVRDLSKRLAEAKQNSLSTEQRLQLSLTLLRALQKQIHDSDLVHRDIKPDNIIIDLDHHRAFIVDLGLAKLTASEHKDGKKIGTLGYMAPEVLQGRPATVASDICSMGITIGALFRAMPDFTLNSEQAFQAANKKNRFRGLFAGIEDITEDEEEKIKNILHRMTSPDPQSRCSIHVAFSVFEAILLQRMLDSAEPSESQAVRQALHSAIELRKKLDNIEADHDGLATNEAVSEVVASLSDVIANHIVDKPHVIEAFTDRLYVLELDGIKDKATLLAKVQTVGSDFTAQQKTLDSMLSKMHAVVHAYDEAEDASEDALVVEAQSVIRRLNEVKALCRRDSSQRMTFDAIAHLNPSVAKQIAVINQPYSLLLLHHKDKQARMARAVSRDGLWSSPLRASERSSMAAGRRKRRSANSMELIKQVSLPSMSPASNNNE